MDTKIKRRRWDPERTAPETPATASSELRGQYEYPLIEIARTVAQMAAQRDKMTTNELLTAPCPLEPNSPLVLAARGACLERGFLADGQVPRGTCVVDRREVAHSGHAGQWKIEWYGMQGELCKVFDATGKEISNGYTTELSRLVEAHNAAAYVLQNEMALVFNIR